MMEIEEDKDTIKWEIEKIRAKKRRKIH